MFGCCICCIDNTYHLMVALFVFASSGYFIGLVPFPVSLEKINSMIHLHTCSLYPYIYWSNNFKYMFSKLFLRFISEYQFLLFEICLSISTIFSVVILLIIQISLVFFMERNRGNIH